MQSFQEVLARGTSFGQTCEDVIYSRSPHSRTVSCSKLGRLKQEHTCIPPCASNRQLPTRALHLHEWQCPPLLQMEQHAGPLLPTAHTEPSPLLPPLRWSAKRDRLGKSDIQYILKMFGYLALFLKSNFDFF